MKFLKDKINFNEICLFDDLYSKIFNNTELKNKEDLNNLKMNDFIDYVNNYNIDKYINLPHLTLYGKIFSAFILP